MAIKIVGYKAKWRLWLYKTLVQLYPYGYVAGLLDYNFRLDSSVYLLFFFFFIVSTEWTLNFI